MPVRVVDAGVGPTFLVRRAIGGRALVVASVPGEMVEESLVMGQSCVCRAPSVRVVDAGVGNVSEGHHACRDAAAKWGTSCGRCL